MKLARAASFCIFLLCATCLSGQNVFVNTDGVTVNLPIQNNVHTIIASIPVGTALGQSPSFDILVTGSIFAAREQTLLWTGLTEASFLSDIFLCDKSDCSGNIKTLVGQAPLVTGQGGSAYVNSDLTSLNNDFRISTSLAVKKINIYSGGVLLTGTTTGEMQQENAYIPVPYFCDGGCSQGSASVVGITTQNPIDLTSSFYVVVDIDPLAWGCCRAPSNLTATVNLLRVHILQ